jgi:hypothetical protein
MRIRRNCARFAQLLLRHRLRRTLRLSRRNCMAAHALIGGGAALRDEVFSPSPLGWGEEDEGKRKIRVF